MHQKHSRVSQTGIVAIGGIVVVILFVFIGGWRFFGERHALFSSPEVSLPHTPPIKETEEAQKTPPPEVAQPPREFPDISKNIPAPSSFETVNSLLENPTHIETVAFPNRTCTFTDYAATSGGKVSNTEAFQKAIDDCFQLGGGTVRVPAGTWLTGPIHLASNINLHLEKGATILFSTNFDEYLPVVFSRFEGIEYYNYSPPIYTANAFNVAITGEGTIDGQGRVWWNAMRKWNKAIKRLYQMGDTGIPVHDRVFGTVNDSLRPAFVEFMNCRRVLIEGIHIKNGPMWTIHPLYSEHIIVRGVTIETSPGPSTDGIAVDSSKNVLIENSSFDTGDDAIVLKSGRNQDGLRVRQPTETVIIRNNTVPEAHAAVAIGSEMSGDVRNVSIENTSANTVQYGLRIKSAQGRGGMVENIRLRSMDIRSASLAAIQLTTAYEDSFIKNSGAIPLFRNITVEDMSVAKTDRSIDINGLPEEPITNVLFKDIRIKTRWGARLHDARAITLDTIFAVPDKGSLFSLAESSDIRFQETACPLVRKDCIVISGPSSTNIDIRNSGFTKDSVTLSEDTNTNVLTSEKQLP